ncbi:hypothetical protein HNV12_14355 [Methanococcoides sp. SA1]|nr:hypothetical protein [Methanococcoides sp. SA1]
MSEKIEVRVVNTSPLAHALHGFKLSNAKPENKVHANPEIHAAIAE